MNVPEMVARWRTEVALFRRRGALEAAETLDDCARECERTFDAWWHEPLDIPAAAAESGYSADHLRELARSGQLRHSRDGHRVLVRRCDLPRHAVAPEHPAVTALAGQRPGRGRVVPTP